MSAVDFGAVLALRLEVFRRRQLQLVEQLRRCVS